MYPSLCVSSHFIYETTYVILVSIYAPIHAKVTEHPVRVSSNDFAGTPMEAPRDGLPVAVDTHICAFALLVRVYVCVCSSISVLR
jgi:hypothetical protein